jgi:hypothetical protein
VVDAARRLRDLPEVAHAGERQEERNRLDTWKSTLRQQMLSAARTLEIAVADLHDALDGMLTIAATTGGAPDSDTLTRIHPELPTVTPMTPSQPDAAVVLLLHSQHGIDAFPTLTLRIAPYVSDAGDLHFASVPQMTPHGQYEAVADALLPYLARVDGPHPMLRQATLDVAHRFVAELTGVFVAAAEHYIVVLSTGGDPADPTVWRGVDRD